MEKIGFGLSLESCTLTNSKENLRYVSPSSGCAVSESVDEKWKNKLLILPSFIVNNKKPKAAFFVSHLKTHSRFCGIQFHLVKMHHDPCQN